MKNCEVCSWPHIEHVCYDLDKKDALFAINDAATQILDDLKADDNKGWKEPRTTLSRNVMK